MFSGSFCSLGFQLWDRPCGAQEPETPDGPECTLEVRSDPTKSCRLSSSMPCFRAWGLLQPSRSARWRSILRHRNVGGASLSFRPVMAGGKRRCAPLFHWRSSPAGAACHLRRACRPAPAAPPAIPARVALCAGEGEGNGRGVSPKPSNVRTCFFCAGPALRFAAALLGQNQ